MGIRYANFMPISNHFARKRAPLCPLTKCYQEQQLIHNLFKLKVLEFTFQVIFLFYFSYFFKKVVLNNMKLILF